MNTSLSRAPESVLIRPKRSLGGLIMQVVVEESHTDELEITEHPVEQGAAINDHAFKKPAQVTIRGGWSNSSKEAGSNANYAAEVYDKLLALQEKREPFDLVTGKRAYRNMLLQSLAVTTDKETENVLMVTATLREVIIVETSVSSVPPRSRQAKPGKTGETEDKGTKQPQSALKAGLGGLFGGK